MSFWISKPLTTLPTKFVTLFALDTAFAAIWGAVDINLNLLRLNCGQPINRGAYTPNLKSMFIIDLLEDRNRQT